MRLLTIWICPRIRGDRADENGVRIQARRNKNAVVLPIPQKLCSGTTIAVSCSASGKVLDKLRTFILHILDPNVQIRERESGILIITVPVQKYR